MPPCVVLGCSLFVFLWVFLCGSWMFFLWFGGAVVCLPVCVLGVLNLWFLHVFVVVCFVGGAVCLPPCFLECFVCVCVVFGCFFSDLGRTDAGAGVLCYASLMGDARPPRRLCLRISRCGGEGGGRSSPASYHRCFLWVDSSGGGRSLPAALTLVPCLHLVRVRTHHAQQCRAQVTYSSFNCRLPGKDAVVDQKVFSPPSAMPLSTVECLYTVFLTTNLLES